MNEISRLQKKICMHLLSPLFHTNSYALAASSEQRQGSTLELAYTSKGDLVSLDLTLCEIFECVSSEVCCGSDLPKLDSGTFLEPLLQCSRSPIILLLTLSLSLSSTQSNMASIHKAHCII